MALPLIALGANLLGKTKIGKRVKKTVGKIGKNVASRVFKNNRSARSQRQSTAPVLTAPPVTIASSVVPSSQGILPGEWPDKIGDVLGKVTAPSREFSTSVEPKTILMVAGAALALILISRK